MKSEAVLRFQRNFSGTADFEHRAAAESLSLSHLLTKRRRSLAEMVGDFKQYGTTKELSMRARLPHAW